MQQIQNLMILHFLLNLNNCVLNEYDKEKTLRLFEELEFTSLAKKLPQDVFEKDVQEALF